MYSSENNFNIKLKSFKYKSVRNTESNLALYLKILINIFAGVMIILL